MVKGLEQNQQSLGMKGSLLLTVCFEANDVVVQRRRERIVHSVPILIFFLERIVGVEGTINVTRCADLYFYRTIQIEIVVYGVIIISYRGYRTKRQKRIS